MPNNTGPMDEQVERVAPVIRDELEKRRFFTRLAIDKSKYEVVNDLDPDGSISDETFKVVGKFDSYVDAQNECARLESESIARAAIEGNYIDDSL